MYRDLHRHLLPTLAWLLPRCGLPRAGALLDCGCGAGEKWPLLREALGEAVQIYGVDTDRAAVAGLAGAVAADAHALPFAAASLDAAVCIATLGGLADPPLALAELRRVLRSAGEVLVVGGTTAWAEVMRWPVDLAEIVMGSGIALPTPDAGEDLASLLRQAGFVPTTLQVSLDEDGTVAQRALALAPWPSLGPLLVGRLTPCQFAACAAIAASAEIALVPLIVAVAAHSPAAAD